MTDPRVRGALRGTAYPPAAYKLYASTTAALTASGDSGVLDTGRYTAGFASVYVRGAVTGTNPSLAVFFDQQDAAGNWIPIVTLTPITAGPNYAVAHVGPPGSYILTPGRLRWVVSGTATPTFNDVDISLYAK